MPCVFCSSVRITGGHGLLHQITRWNIGMFGFTCRVAVDVTVETEFGTSCSRSRPLFRKSVLKSKERSLWLCDLPAPSLPSSLSWHSENNLSFSSKAAFPASAKPGARPRGHIATLSMRNGILRGVSVSVHCFEPRKTKKTQLLKDRVQEAMLISNYR